MTSGRSYPTEGGYIVMKSGQLYKWTFQEILGQDVVPEAH